MKKEKILIVAIALFLVAGNIQSYDFINSNNDNLVSDRQESKKPNITDLTDYEGVTKQLKQQLEKSINRHQGVDSSDNENYLNNYNGATFIDIVDNDRVGVIREVSAYNVGDVYQCDDTPCIAANNEDICKALDMGYKRCAANFVKFGTILEIEGYGQCMVVDRMNKRYKQAVDIAFPFDQKKEALQWGRRNVRVKIIK